LISSFIEIPGQGLEDERGQTRWRDEPEGKMKQEGESGGDMNRFRDVLAGQ